MDITSANSTFTISSADISLASTNLEGYSVDSAFDIDESEMAVAQIGVDGKMSVGWVPRLINITLTFAPNSPSITVFDTILTTADLLRAPVLVNAVLQVPSINKSFTFMKGAVTRAKQMPGGNRVLGQQSFVITFESVKPAIL